MLAICVGGLRASRVAQCLRLRYRESFHSSLRGVEMRPKPVRSMAAMLIGAAAITLAPAQRSTVSMPVYRRPSESVELRIDDLMRRMTLAAKVRQLDLYAGAKALVDKRTDETHAAPGSVFLPDKAQALF